MQLVPLHSTYSEKFLIGSKKKIYIFLILNYRFILLIDDIIYFYIIDSL